MSQIKNLYTKHFENIPKFLKWYIYITVGNTEAGQFSRGKEKTKQWNYYEAIASFTLCDKRLDKVRHVNPDV